jgi:hypothetical protein
VINPACTVLVCTCFTSRVHLIPIHINCTHNIYHTRVLPVLNIPHTRTHTLTHIHTISAYLQILRYPRQLSNTHTQFGISDLKTGTLLHGSTFSVTAFTFTLQGFGRLQALGPQTSKEEDRQPLRDLHYPVNGPGHTTLRPHISLYPNPLDALNHHCQRRKQVPASTPNAKEPLERLLYFNCDSSNRSTVRSGSARQGKIRKRKGKSSKQASKQARSKHTKIVIGHHQIIKSSNHQIIAIVTGGI